MIGHQSINIIFFKHSNKMVFVTPRDAGVLGGKMSWEVFSKDGIIYSIKHMSLQSLKSYAVVSKMKLKGKKFRIVLRHTYEYMSPSASFSKRYVIAEDETFDAIKKDWDVLQEKLIPIIKDIIMKKRRELFLKDLESFVSNPHQFKVPKIDESAIIQPPSKSLTASIAKNFSFMSPRSEQFSDISTEPKEPIIYEGELVKEGHQVLLL